MSSKVILCIEDNLQVQLFNKPLLEAKGFTVRLAMTIAEAQEAIGRETPELIILDIHLPDGNGLDFLRELRKTSTIPVIALTNDDKEKDIVLGFESGCDDYVPKPYTFPVLYARIERLLRHVSTVPEILEKGALRIDILAGQAFWDNKDLLLTQKEFALLMLFMKQEGQALGAEYIYEKIWNTPFGSNDRTLRTQISNFRRKIECSDYTVEAVRGLGYRFCRKVEIS